MTKKYPLLVYHLLFWLLFMAYELLGIRLTIGFTGPLLHYPVFYAFYISLFYVNAHMVLDFAFFRTRYPYLVATGLIFLELLVFGILKVFIDRCIHGAYPPWGRNYIFTNSYRMVYFIGLSIAYWSTLSLFRFRERNHRMEKEKLVVENAYLQNQVSPHLLFNSLNFIYNTVHNVSEKAGNGVMLLSDLLRYSLISVEDKDTVPLSMELEQIENMVRLNQLRFDNQLFLIVKKKGKVKDREILPLILLTLVENMMKHGDLGEPDSPALIRLEVTPQQLVFGTTNKKRTGALFPKGGLGLVNIEKRLANFYPGRYALAVHDEEQEFSTLLTLIL
jgi:two-component system LytT family sensor kinase